MVVVSVNLVGCNERENTRALGTLERDRIAHTATANEIIIKLPVLPGSVVKAGDLLVELDSQLQQAQVAKAKAKVAQAEANLDKLIQGAREEELAAARAKVDGAKANVVESEANYLRAKNLAESNLTSQANLSRTLAMRDESSAKLEAAKEELKQLTNGTRIEDLTAAEAELAAAVAEHNSELRILDDLSVVSTRDGILDNLPWNLGERVTKGSPIAIVLAGEAPFARVYIPETHRVKIKLEDSLTVYVDGLEQSIIGKVRWISNESAFSPYYALNQEERSRLMYLAEIQLPTSASELPSGLPAQVELP